MATTTPPTISGLPTPPDPNDRSTFNTRAYPWSIALPTFGTEVSAVAANVKANADDAATQANNAANSAAAALSAALVSGATVWVSDTTYSIGDVRYSPSNFQTYRRKTAGAGTTDPSLDATNWIIAVAGEVTLTGAETLRNKRISAFYIVDKTVVNAAATGGISLDISAATVFDYTLSGDATLSVSAAPTLSGETLAFTVKVTQGGTARLLNWFSGITWLTTGGVAPAAPAANKTIEYIFTTSAAGVYQGRKGAST